MTTEYDDMHRRAIARCLDRAFGADRDQPPMDAKFRQLLQQLARVPEPDRSHRDSA